MEPFLARASRSDFDPRSVGSDPVLLEKVRTEIAASGPMTFARFMEIALSDPENGYYATSAERPTRAGDFLTAPELHPIFGRTLARTLEATWQLLGRPDPFVVHEYGAGSGALAIAMLDELRGAGSAPLRGAGSALLAAIRYVPHDVSLVREEAVRARVAEAGLPVAGRAPASPWPGVVLANEFLDALPVHRVVWHGSELLERYVVTNGEELAEASGPPSTPSLARRLADEGIVLSDGQEAEVCLALEPWADEAAGLVNAGLVLVIDYGAPAVELYDASRRPNGTVLAYARHRAHTSLLANVGRQDLTAHVDLTALERALARNGFVPLGRSTQSAFLIANGLEAIVDRIRSDPATDIEEWALVRASVARLLDPRALGSFAVVAFGRGLPENAARIVGANEGRPRPPRG